MTSSDIREALQQNNGWLTSVWEGMPVGVVITGPDGEVKAFNPAALALLGVTEDQLMGTTSFDPAWNTIHEDRSPFQGGDHPIPRAIATRQPVAKHRDGRNSAYCLINGYTVSELATMNSRSITHSEDLAKQTYEVRRLLAGEIPSFVIEKRNVRKDGSEVWVRNSVSLLRDG